MPTKIEWTQETWNPVTGCTKISQGCQNCYAETMTKRLQAMGQEKYAAGFDKVVCHPECLNEPLHWKKPRMVFVSSMADLFHEDVPNEFIARVWATMWQCSPSGWVLDDPLSSLDEGHTFQVLTKRPERMRDLLTSREFIGQVEQLTCTHFIDEFPPVLPNIWLGTTVENDQHYDRIEDLLQIPAAVHFVSAEPLLSGLDLSPWLFDDEIYVHDELPGCPVEYIPRGSKIDWVICGGETGHGARPIHPAWARSLRDDCVAAGVPFFFKSWGEWAEIRSEERAVEAAYAKNGRCAWVCPDGRWESDDDPRDNLWDESGARMMLRVGKKRAGRLLDGREWNEMPGVPH